MSQASSKSSRQASIERNTKETQIKVDVNLDGTGVLNVETGLPFLDHMLDQIARHGLIDLSMTISGYYLAFLREDTILIGFLILGVDIIHTFVVTILLLVGNYKDGDGGYITYPGQILKQN